MIVDFKEDNYSYEKLIGDAYCLANKYSEILKYVTVGKSHDNRDIILLKLGVGKQHMICCSGVHARENVNPIVMLRIIEDYAEFYYKHKKQKQEFKKKDNYKKIRDNVEYENILYGTCIYEILQTFTILFIPLLNPDGYMISLYGFDVINNPELRAKCIAKNESDTEWKFNARGVDLNRNFPSLLYRPKDPGDYAASENETKALISLFHDYRSKGFLDFHSRGKQIYYYRRIMSEAYNAKQKEIALRLAGVTNYVLNPPEIEVDPGDTGGNTVHYYSERFKKPALTIETIDEDAKFPLDIKYRESTFDELKLVILEFGSRII
jgi:g-D-glutamyl-meso-diaminopimelate peptidase